MEDQKIIQLLREKNQDSAFLKLYKNYPSVEKLIRSKGGTKEDAKDIFQEALLVFYEKVSTSDFKLTSTISTYLYSVCRFLWKDQMNKRKINTTTLENENFSSDMESEMLLYWEKEDKFKQIEDALNQLGEKCLKILTLFYYKKVRMKMIAQQLGITSEKAAKTQKYKCLEQAKENISNHLN